MHPFYRALKGDSQKRKGKPSLMLRESKSSSTLFLIKSIEICLTSTFTKKRWIELMPGERRRDPHPTLSTPKFGRRALWPTWQHSVARIEIRLSTATPIRAQPAPVHQKQKQNHGRVANPPQLRLNQNQLVNWIDARIIIGLRTVLSSILLEKTSSKLYRRKSYVVVALV